MIYSFQSALNSHLGHFDTGMTRATALASSKIELEQPPSLHLREVDETEVDTLMADVKNLAAVIAVGAVDLYFKSLWTEIPIAYLYGLLDPPGKIRTEISSVVARLVLDSVRNDMAGNIPSTFHDLAVAEHRRSLEKKNFQGYEDIKRSLKELGFPAVSKLFTNNGTSSIPINQFRDTLDQLTLRRHVVVHRTGLPNTPSPLFDTSNTPMEPLPNLTDSFNIDSEGIHCIHSEILKFSIEL